MDGKFFSQRIENGKEIIELREPIPLKPEYLKDAEEEKAELQTADAAS
jgi:hypothetical protein